MRCFSFLKSFSAKCVLMQLFIIRTKGFHMKSVVKCDRFKLQRGKEVEKERKKKRTKRGNTFGLHDLLRSYAAIIRNNILIWDRNYSFDRQT